MPTWEYRILEIKTVDARLDLFALDGKEIERSERSRDPFYADGNPIVRLPECCRAGRLGDAGLPTGPEFRWRKVCCLPDLPAAYDLYRVMLSTFPTRLSFSAAQN